MVFVVIKARWRHPDTIRTCDLCLRRAALYPAELRVPLALDSRYRAPLQCESASMRNTWAHGARSQSENATRTPVNSYSATMGWAWLSSGSPARSVKAMVALPVSLPEIGIDRRQEGNTGDFGVRLGLRRESEIEDQRLEGDCVRLPTGGSARHRGRWRRADILQRRLAPNLSRRPGRRRSATTGYGRHVPVLRHPR